jgi:hypothetical protein
MVSKKVRTMAAQSKESRMAALILSDAGAIGGDGQDR